MVFPCSLKIRTTTINQSITPQSQTSSDRLYEFFDCPFFHRMMLEQQIYFQTLNLQIQINFHKAFRLKLCIT